MSNDELMMQVTCLACGAIEILTVGQRDEVIHAIVHQTGRCLKCQSGSLAYRELRSEFQTTR